MFPNIYSGLGLFELLKILFIIVNLFIILGRDVILYHINVSIFIFHYQALTPPLGNWLGNTLHVSLVNWHVCAGWLMFGLVWLHGILMIV